MKAINRFFKGRQLTIKLHNCCCYFLVSFLACELNAAHFQEKSKLITFRIILDTELQTNASTVMAFACITYQNVGVLAECRH